MSSMESLGKPQNFTSGHTQNLHINKIPQGDPLALCLSSHWSTLDGPSHPCGSMIRGQIFFRVHLISSISPPFLERLIISQIWGTPNHPSSLPSTVTPSWEASQAPLNWISNSLLCAPHALATWGLSPFIHSPTQGATTPTKIPLTLIRHQA